MAENDVPSPSGEACEVSPTVATKPLQRTIRHDWYQTGSDVYINVMLKGLAKDAVSVSFSPTLVSVKIENTEQHHHLQWNLAHSVVTDKCRYKVLSTKIELKMRKESEIHWATLEAPAEPVEVVRKVDTSSAGVDTTHKYPSSSHYTRNWDNLVTQIKKEEEEEKPEGDAALNKLFQDIYSRGNDEVRRAMNKSFVESKGTVLSTNWQDIGSKDVEMKAPDGMEWKKYD